MAIPWPEIEQEYITTSIGQRELAKKYGVTLPSINNHSRAGNWVQRREAYVREKQKEEEKEKVEVLPGEGYYVLELPPDAQDLKPRQRYQLYASLVKEIPKIDTSDPVQVQNRIASYFDCCNKNDIAPSPADMARWLKISMEVLRRWRIGEARKATHHQIIEIAFTKLEADLVNRVQVGAISPPSGIFLLKNWFNYKDVQDVVVTPKNPLGDLQNPEELRKRIEGTIVVDDFNVVEEKKIPPETETQK